MVTVPKAERRSMTSDVKTALRPFGLRAESVIDAAQEVLRYTGHQAEIRLRPDMPTGPLNRVADNSLGRDLLGWEPEVPFMEGLHRTTDWYFGAKDRDQVRAELDYLLTER